MENNHQRPFIDYYKKHKISPVSQDISDLKKHYDRRAFLYRRLGILPSFLNGRTVIEFGPGSGYNSLFTLSLQPLKYVLVDGNPTALKGCIELFTKYFPREKNYELVDSLIEEYHNNELFDLVISEGLIPNQKDPAQFARSIAGFTKPGGVCVITCQDAVGVFADLLRYLIGNMVINEGLSYEENVNVLVAMFKPHLESLKGMSRPHQDWVADAILHKDMWCRGSHFSIGHAIEALDSSFDVYGVSPYIFTDWRWYKDVFGKQRAFNAVAKECYLRNLHNFLDYRFEFPARSAEDNIQLMGHCQAIWELIKLFGEGRDKKYIEAICTEISRLEMKVRDYSPSTADSLADFLLGLKQYPEITGKTNWGRFSDFWGRGMQYLSFIRTQ
ncbi:MAG: methyltransferase domain-containing protein [Candidatus Omnitrophica bacterium]|nr:methyltransferase domain-containing protein [Candidatus Omnitrophota bacterium]